jgi:hypothetical protein
MRHFLEDINVSDPSRRMALPALGSLMTQRDFQAAAHHIINLVIYGCSVVASQ